MPMGFPLEDFLSPVFIETGLYKGRGLRRALAAGFPKIYNIEIENEHINTIAAELPNVVESGRVTLIHGDSAVELPKLLQTIDEPCTFWLDAHWGGKRGHQGPLLAEVQAIREHGRDDHIVLIDDLRMMRYWGVDMARIKTILRKINPDYTFRKLDGCKPNDVLAAIPPRGL